MGPADMGGGGRPGKILVGLGGKSDSFWRRDLSALGPFGAEANFQVVQEFIHPQYVWVPIFDPPISVFITLSWKAGETLRRCVQRPLFDWEASQS